MYNSANSNFDFTWAFLRGRLGNRKWVIKFSGFFGLLFSAIVLVQWHANAQTTTYTLRSNFVLPVKGGDFFKVQNVQGKCSVWGGDGLLSTSEPIITAEGPFEVTVSYTKPRDRSSFAVTIEPKFSKPSFYNCGWDTIGFRMDHPSEAGSYQTQNVVYDYWYDVAASKLTSTVSKVKQGRRLNLNYTATNLGQNPSEKMPITFFLLDKPSFLTSRRRVSLGKVIRLPADEVEFEVGEEVSGMISLNIPKSVKPGRYFIGMTVDASMEEEELDCYRNVSFDPKFPQDNNSLVASKAITVTR